MGIVALIIIVVLTAFSISLWEKWVAPIDNRAKAVIYGLLGFLAFAVIILTILQMLGVVQGHPLWF